MKVHAVFAFRSLVLAAVLMVIPCLDASFATAEITIVEFQPESPICRAERPVIVRAVFANQSERNQSGTVQLDLPAEVRLLKGDRKLTLAFQEDEDETSLSWTVEALREGRHELAVTFSGPGEVSVRKTLALLFLPSVSLEPTRKIPEPEVIATDMLVGAHHCPLWEADAPELWRNVLKHPERTPALGFYCQENPEVADWETKWAVEHGISFFVYCWYRASQGQPVQVRRASAIHDALFHSRFRDKIRFAIMWENQARGIAGVANEEDLLQNLLPYWIENYFRQSNYLVIDNKPLLFIYRPEFLIQDLGGVEQVRSALEKMREACRQAGFGGIYLLGEYRGTNPKHLQLMKDLGLDYTFAYVWPIPNNPTPAQAIQTQMAYIKKTQELNILPQVITVSQGWSGWRDEGSIWKLPPEDFERLLREAKAFARTLPPHQLGSRLLLLDNWNEWGEGHYLAPHREFGFGYLDAVRRVFSNDNRPHIDLIPEDLGLGPYDIPIRTYFQKERQMRQMVRKRVKPTTEEEGLIAWWTFDENDDDEVTFDYSGHRLGGILHQIKRVQGWRGRALDCRGGCVIVPCGNQISDLSQLSVECWVRTDLPDQHNKWIINRVFGGAETTGFRLGVLYGKPSFQIPVTPWSHHLVGNLPLPTDRWVHLVGTFDGTTMRLYMDGQEVGTMERPGRVAGNDRHIILGNYDVDHPAYFTGLLDEVRIYNRVLPQGEIVARARPSGVESGQP
jgi:hypothetical protein